MCAGTVTVAWPAAGSSVADPPYTARMIREGPGDRVALHAPVLSVVALATWAN